MIIRFSSDGPGEARLIVGHLTHLEFRKKGRPPTWHISSKRGSIGALSGTLTKGNRGCVNWLKRLLASPGPSLFLASSKRPT